MKYVAFISHSNKDGKALHSVREYLEKCGFSCFASERDLRHNANWQTQLVDAMDNSSMLVYLHSRAANDSAEVSREINYFADKCHRPILVYRLDDVPYNKDRAYYLQSINYIDSLLRPEDGLDRLADNVRNTLNGLPAQLLDDPAARRRRKLLRIGLPILAAILLAVGLLGFHAWEKKEMRTLLAESAGILARAEDWLAREDSLAFVLPAIDRAEEKVRQCDRLLTVTPSGQPDFEAVREQALQTIRHPGTEDRDRESPVRAPEIHVERKRGCFRGGYPDEPRHHRRPGLPARAAHGQGYRIYQEPHRLH